MEKPVGFRPDTWRYILTTLGSIDPERLNRPGQLAVDSGLISRDDLLSDTVIELTDECEYLIDREGARALRDGAPVTLTRLYDHKRRVLSPEELQHAFSESTVFDQLY